MEGHAKDLSGSEKGLQVDCSKYVKNVGVL